MRPLKLTLLTIAAALSAAIGSGIPAQAEDRSYITLSGTETSYLDLSFKRPFSLEEVATQINYEGRYAGWVLHRLGEPVDISEGNLAGGFVVRNLVPPGESGDEPLFDIGFKNDPLDPGRYRLYLFTDGPARIRIPIKDGTSAMALRPTQEAASGIRLKRFVIGPAGTARQTVRSPVHLRRTTLGVSMVIAYSDTGLSVERLGACFDLPGGDCSDTPGTAGYVFSPFSRFSVGLAVFYEPGAVPPGEYEAIQHVTSAGSVVDARGAALMLDLEGP